MPPMRHPCPGMPCSCGSRTVSWAFPREDKPKGWLWAEVLGITCDEILFLVLDPNRTIARVKLSSLGPGTLPD